MKKSTAAIFLTVFCIILYSTVSFAYDQLVTKKVFELMEYVTLGGQKISPVRIGYETYGTLNAAKDNVILICHHFSGTSHAAGKYSAEEKVPGYWDAIIGSGKPLDTDNYFIISTDTICNLNTKDPTVTTTGPASINPATGRPYAMTFPIITIRDMVRVQYELLKSLGIQKLRCVTGASMGGLQSLEWAVTYPEVVERAIPVIAGPKNDGWTVALLNLWSAPIILDPKWNNGDYYGKPEPIDGLANSLKLITLNARSPWWADGAFGRKPADPAKNPYSAMENKFLIEDVLDKAGLGRAKMGDANSLLYLAKANMLYDISYGYNNYEEALKRITAKVLMVPCNTDILIYPHNAKEFVDALNKVGGKASLFEIQTREGHIGGITEITKAGERIGAFLTE
ncbi:MAG TPA: homoserine O-acetyltransferase [Thermodesulfobacteriota bacterium]|nr:homoserine O-acetyltransferase [Thermodesulfobacteriota bacterium]